MKMHKVRGYDRGVLEGEIILSIFVEMSPKRTTSPDLPFDVELQLKSDVINDTP